MQTGEITKKITFFLALSLRFPTSFGGFLGARKACAACPRKHENRPAVAPPHTGAQPRGGKSIPNGMQKVWFRLAKGYLLRGKTTPFCKFLTHNAVHSAPLQAFLRAAAAYLHMKSSTRRSPR